MFLEPTGSSDPQAAAVWGFPGPSVCPCFWAALPPSQPQCLEPLGAEATGSVPGSVREELAGGDPRVTWGLLVLSWSPSLCLRKIGSLGPVSSWKF